MVNSITNEGHIVGLNSNRHWRGDYICGEQCEQRSTAHGDDVNLESKSKWGVANASTGRDATNYLDLAFVLGIVRNYFNSFLSPEDNPIVGFIVKSLTSLSSTLEGKRDEVMYKRIYGVGADGHLSDEEIADPKLALNKLPYTDDVMENKRQGLLYGERVVGKLGEYATSAANLKPIAHFIGGFLGNGYRSAIETFLDMPARFYWRTRFFATPLHNNFVSTAWDLARLGTMSIFSREASGKLGEKIKELEAFSKEYFKDKHPEDEKYKAKSGLGLYFRMLADRVGQHWRDIFHAKEALEEKKKKGFVKDSDRISETTQMYSSITDFTAPFCAGLGLITTTIFDPLKVLWGVAGFEKGKNLINALSASRKSFQLLNYIPRFIIPEMIEGSIYSQHEESIKNGTASEATKQLYYARKERYTNALVGMLMATGNIIEPVGHFLKSRFEDNRFLNFLFDSFVKFNDDFFVRFFSKRRETRGRIAFLKSLFMLEKKKDTSELSYTLDDLKDKATETTQSMPHMRNGTFEQVFTPLSKLSDSIKNGLDEERALQLAS